MTLQLLTFAAGEVYAVVLRHLCILLACVGKSPVQPVGFCVRIRLIS